MNDQQERFFNSVQLSGYIRSLNKKESKSDNSTIVEFALCQERTRQNHDTPSIYPYHCFARWDLADRIYALITENIKVTILATAHDYGGGSYDGHARPITFRVREVQLSLMSDVFDEFNPVDRQEDPKRSKDVEDLIKELS